MKITRNVILDLLPLYLANEVSADTRVLVEEFIENDPELAQVVNKSELKEMVEDIPMPLNEEDEMKAYKKTRWMLVLYIIITAAICAFVGIALLVAFFLPA